MADLSGPELAALYERAVAVLQEPASGPSHLRTAAIEAVAAGGAFQRMTEGGAPLREYFEAWQRIQSALVAFGAAAGG